MITQKRLKELLFYRPETGVFYWKNTRRGVQSVGQVAGSIYSNGYRVIHVDKCRQGAHRLAFLYMTGRLPDKYVDHINGNKDDNSWANLRSVSCSENGKNQKLGARNTNGVLGVRFRDHRCRWEAVISVEGKQRYIGHFTTLFDAVCKRKSKELEYGYHENHGRAA